VGQTLYWENTDNNDHYHYRYHYNVSITAYRHLSTETTRLKDKSPHQLGHKLDKQNTK